LPNQPFIEVRYSQPPFWEKPDRKLKKKREREREEKEKKKKKKRSETKKL